MGADLEHIEKLLGGLFDGVRDWSSTLDGSTVAASVVLLLLVFLARKVLANASVRALEYVAGNIQIALDEKVKDALVPAAQALILSLALFGFLDTLNLPPLLDQTLQRLLISVAIASVFAAGYSLVDTTVGWIVSASDQVRGLQLVWLKKVLKAVVVLLGLSAVLKVWEIDLGPVLTGMGVLGAGVALAAQDIFRNLIAGIASMSEKRFDIGDWVRVEGVVEGIVEKMELRSTQIRQFDQAAVHVPNADLANSTLINYTRRPHRRINWSIQLVYGTTAEQLGRVRNEIEQYIDASEDFVPADRASRYVRIDAFDENSINILVWCFTRTIDYATYLEAKERLLLEIKRIVEASGTSFAFPTRSIVVEQAAGSAPVAPDGQEDPALP